MYKQYCLVNKSNLEAKAKVQERSNMDSELALLCNIVTDDFDLSPVDITDSASAAGVKGYWDISK